MSARLAVESLAARAAGTPSRARRRGRRYDAARQAALEARSRRDRRARRPAAAGRRASSRRRTARRRRPRWWRRSSRPASARPQQLRARTSSPGVASTLLAARGAELGLLEVDEARPARGRCAGSARARVLLGNLFRDQLDRYGELEHIAERWRAGVAELPDGDDARRERGRPAGRRSRPRPRRGRSPFGLDDPRHARPRAPARRRLDATASVCGTPYEYAAAYVGHLGDYRCPDCGHARAAARRRGARDRAATASTASSFELATPEGSTPVRLPLPGLYNVYNALGAAALAQALGASLDEIVARASSASAPRSAASSGSRSAAVGCSCC